MVRWSVVLAATALLASGCLGEEAAPSTAENLELDGTPAALQVLGDEPTALEVWVLDEALYPIPGGRVILPEADRTATTDADGKARFEGLEPGPEIVEVRVVGMVEASALAFVEPRGTTSLNLILQPDPTYIAPAITTIAFEGFIEGTETGFTAGSGDDTFYNDCQCVFQREGEQGIKAHVIEIVWEDSVEKPVGDPREFRFLLDSRESTFDWFVAQGPSPLQVTVPIQAFEHADGPLWELMVYMEEDWVRYQQPFQVFWTTFVETDVPDGWSALD
ncbi:MAG: carboxypeptidase-like regulatory domain-containing protein [Thermoplasmatota archaeon]